MNLGRVIRECGDIVFETAKRATLIGALAVVATKYKLDNIGYACLALMLLLAAWALARVEALIDEEIRPALGGRKLLISFSASAILNAVLFTFLFFIYASLKEVQALSPAHDAHVVAHQQAQTRAPDPLPVNSVMRVPAQPVSDGRGGAKPRNHSGART